MARSTGLGEFLRARRALVRPEDVGLQAGPGVGAFRGCGVRSWQRLRASAPITTCGWSRAGISTRRRR